MNIAAVLSDIERGKVLDTEESMKVMQSIVSGELNETQIAALLFGLQMRGLHHDEVMGFSDALLQMCSTINLPKDAIDLCGTGGDHKNTFNISTLTALLLGTMGYPVIKHGNYGSTSITGSSQVMELLGYQFFSDEKALQRQFEQFGFCYLHAPLFHKSLAKVASIRKQLKLRTIFNILGPISNPCEPTFRFHGVNVISLARLYSIILEKRKKQFNVYHSIDGHDEVTLTAPYITYTNHGKKLHYPSLDEHRAYISESATKNGETPQEAFLLFRNIIQGKGTPAQNAIIAHNTAMAIHLYKNKTDEDLYTTREHCLNELLSGSVDAWLKKVILLQQSMQ